MKKKRKNRFTECFLDKNIQLSRDDNKAHP